MSRANSDSSSDKKKVTPFQFYFFWLVSGLWLLLSCSADATEVPSVEIRRGALIYLSDCFSCHSLSQVNWQELPPLPSSRLSQQLQGLLVPNNFHFEGPIISRMLPENGRVWFHTAPPDFSLLIGLHDIDWFQQWMQTNLVDANRDKIIDQAQTLTQIFQQHPHGLLQSIWQSDQLHKQQAMNDLLTFLDATATRARQLHTQLLLHTAIFCMIFIFFCIYCCRKIR